MGDRHDYVALEWVKGEIAETLKQARHALEAFVESPQDLSRIRFCLAYIHQVQGTLQMVEFYGAALLAEEMEQLAQAMLDDRTGNRGEALEVLMQAILQLPVYLERIQTARRDLPLVVLPLLNDLRVARGEGLLSETSLFAPDLGGPAPLSETALAALRTPETAVLLRKLRQMLQLALVGVIRDQDVATNLGYLAKVFVRLESLCRNAPLGPLWEISAALVEGLGDGSVSLGGALRDLLRQVEKELKRLVEQGVDGINQPAPEELLRGLLFYAAKAAVGGARLQALKARYRLDELLPDSGVVDEERARLAGPDRDAMRSVVAALCEELVRVKDSLDLFVRSDRRQLAELESLLPPLKQVGDTLGVLGFGQPRKIVVDQLEAIRDLARGQRTPDDALLMDVAGALLYVEATLAGMVGTAEERSREESLLPTTDVAQIHQMVIKEARTGLEQAKDAIIEFIASQWNHEHLQRVPLLLTQVRGGLSMIPLARASALIDGCNRYIQEQLLVGRVVPDWQSLDTLADAITGIEYYLERLSEDHGSASERLLDVAEESLASLGYPLAEKPSILDRDTAAPVCAAVPAAVEAVAAQAAPEPEPADTPASIQAGFPASPAVEPAVAAPETPVPAAPPAAELLPPAGDAQAPAPAEEAEAQPSLAEVLASPVQAINPPAAEVPPSLLPPPADEVPVDEDLLEVFIEEAGEVLETLGEYFPHWCADTSDQEALTEVRRAFHTLKGSGRMVRALVIGELAWSIENLLNRVLDRSIQPDAAVRQVVAEVLALMPALVEEFAAKAQRQRDDVDRLAATAHALALGVEPAAPAEAEPGVLPPSADEAGDGLDAQLLEIFRNEAAVHLQTLDRFLAACARELPQGVTDDLQRALHTLKGSAHMAGLLPIAEIAMPLERLVKEYKTNLILIDLAEVELLQRAAQLLRRGLDQLDSRPLAPIDGSVAFLAEVRRLHQERLEAAKEGWQDDSGNVRDPRQIGRFLAEDMDTLLDAEDLLRHWRAQPAQAPELAALLGELETLGAGARQAELAQIDALCQALLALYGAVQAGHLSLGERFFDEAEAAHEALIGMLDQVAAALEVTPQPERVAALQALLDERAIAEPLEVLPVETPGLAAVVSESEASIPALYELGLAEPDVSEAAAELAEPSPAQPEPAIAEPLEVLPVETPGLAAVVPESEASIPALYELDLVEPDASEVAAELAEPSPAQPVPAIAEPLEVLPVETPGLAAVVPESGAVIPALQSLELAAPELPAREPAEPSIAEPAPGQPEPLAAPPEVAEPAPAVPEAAAVTPGMLPGDGEVDDELAALFLEEALDLLESSARTLQRWLRQPEDSLALTALLRDLHTLKGGARMAGIAPIADLAHELEDLYEALLEQARPDLAGLGALLERSHDRLAQLVEQLQARLPLGDPQDLVQALQGWRRQAAAFTPEARGVRAGVLEPVALEAFDEALSFAESFDLAVDVPAFDRPLLDFSTGQDAPLEGVAEPGPVQALLAPECDPELVEIFLEEGFDILESAGAALQRWLARAAERTALEALQRDLHTLKGGARMAGIGEIGDLAHELEFLYEGLGNGRLEAGPALAGLLQACHDRLAVMLEALRERRPLPDGEALIAAIRDWCAGIREPEAAASAVRAEPASAVAPQPLMPAQPEAVEAALAEPVPAAATPLSLPGGPLLAASEVAAGTAASKTLPFVQRAAEAAREAAAQRAPQEMVRVPAELLESLVNLAGETSIFRGRVEQQVSDIGFTLAEMESTIERVRDQLRRLDTETQAQILSRYQAEAERAGYEDFDPLEMDRHSQLQQLSRALFESASDLLDLKETLAARSRDAETLLLQQARVNTELQEGLMRTRMVPFERLLPRLRRVVRQVAGELDKPVEFSVGNAEGEMDRSVLERIVAPLEHMLRNAIDHGIEPAEVRRAAGKPEQGSIRLELLREGGDILLTLADDGSGIRLDAVRRKAVERGLMKPGAQLSDHEVLQFILEAGFSTADRVTQISGRGVGMDVVHSEVKQLGGSMSIESTPGAGTRFLIRLPFTVSINRALMVLAGEDLYAVPLNTIEGIVRVAPRELEALYARRADGQKDQTGLEYAGKRYELRYLGELLDNGQQPRLAGQHMPLPVILLRSSEQAVAVQVDGLAGSREIVVKSLGPQFAVVPGISGATILGDGRVVVILDLLATLRERLASLQPSVPILSEVPAEAEKERPLLVMVVDDSVTVRKVTGRLLERHGMDCMIAKDGVDALAQLQERRPDVMLLDIEMPRMDGFEVATRVRHDERLKDLPIIMITSRTGEKHRDRALALGVDEYLGKPYQEALLLETIRRLAGEPEAR
ncbi:hybrid sensor histidine kinase/response regulator [Azotobacter chroococcum subsp. isscasi]|uniref:hybrid sensor histidine kinase/response regulator n=1 Tax=Azotobacter chroococcum TaxID=353 RepID=UPI00103C94B0|nr:Hpt domain-containing protein [Azotobacter chroococcum]TBW07116.1 hybrid sensor histidine kinase/response regulator [Azotobacter chroococcum subsp. isscasi]